MRVLTNSGRGERTAPLTRTEYALLETLMRRPGVVVRRDTLIEQGWGAESDVNGASLYVFIRSLRSKITQPWRNGVAAHSKRRRLFAEERTLVRAEVDGGPLHLFAADHLVFVGLFRWSRFVRDRDVVQPGAYPDANPVPNS